MSTQPLIYIHTRPVCLAEKQYVFELLLRQHLGLDFELIPNREMEDGYDLRYAGVDREIFIENHFFFEENWLETAKIPTKPLEIEQFEGFGPLTGFFGKPTFGSANGHIALKLDIIASAFFLLTAWEEIADKTHDIEGRFPSKSSFLVRHNLHQKCLIERYADTLFQLMQSRGLNLEKKVHRMRLLLSCDVDFPLLWPSRFSKIKTLAGSLLKRQSPEEFAYWSSWNRPFDPFDSFDFLMDLAEAKGGTLQFNFLAPERGDKDFNYGLNAPFVQSLVQKIKKRDHVIGLHPSRSSFGKPEKMKEEKHRLERACGAEISFSRQHFLKLRMPETMRHLAEIGIREEGSLGYSDLVGFRCGTVRPFPVFDVLEKKQLSLVERPLVAMDVSMVLHQQLSPLQVEIELSALKAEVQRFGGDFSFLWHNSSIYGPIWDKYRPVFQEFIQKF